jgi:hypothetical protein
MTRTDPLLTACLVWRRHHSWWRGRCTFCGKLQADVRKAQLDRVNRSNRTQTAQSHGDTAQRE